MIDDELFEEKMFEEPQLPELEPKVKKEVTRLPATLPSQALINVVCIFPSY